MDLTPAQELVVLLRRDHFILSLAVCKPMTSCHVVVNKDSTDSPTSVIVQLGTSVSQYTEYTEIWGQDITVYYHINMLYLCLYNSFATQSSNGQSHDNHTEIGMY